MKLLTLTLLGVFIISYLSSVQTTNPFGANNAATAAGKAIADIFANGEFETCVKDIAKLAGKFLGVIGPLVSFILALIPGHESPQMKFMKHAFAEINNKLDVMSDEFKGLSRKVSWDTEKVAFASLESKIDEMTTLKMQLINAPNKEVAEFTKTQFINNYMNRYSGTTIELYNDLVNENGVFSSGIVKGAIKYFQRNRKEVQTLLLGVVQLLMRGIEIDTYYVSLTQKSGVQKYEKELWNKRLQKVQNLLKKVDDNLAIMKKEQLEKDAKAAVVKTYTSDNQHFANNVQAILQKKYYWRYWGVVVSNKVQPDDYDYYFKYQICNPNAGGFITFRDKMIVYGSATNRSFEQHSFLSQTLQNDIQSIKHSVDYDNWLSEKVLTGLSPTFKKKLTQKGNCDIEWVAIIDGSYKPRNTYYASYFSDTKWGALDWWSRTLWFFAMEHQDNFK